MAAAYESLGSLDSCTKYLNEALKIKESNNDKNGMVVSLINMGAIFSKHNRFDKMAECGERAVQLSIEINNKMLLSHSLNALGTAYYRMKQLDKALKYFTMGFKVSKELGYPENIRNSTKNLYNVYKLKGNYIDALTNYELYIQMRDSLNNEKTRKASIKSQLKYEYEKQAAADSVVHAKESEIKNVQLQKQSAEIKAKKNQQYALFGGLGLVIIFAGFMYNRFKITQKQKFIIEEQKLIVEQQKYLVEEKQKEILDSISYARRIQMALIPSEKYIERIMKKLKPH